MKKYLVCLVPIYRHPYFRRYAENAVASRPARVREADNESGVAAHGGPMSASSSKCVSGRAVAGVGI